MSTGPKPTTRLYVRHMQPEQQEAFESAPIDSLDEEIRAAKASLDWAYAKWAADPNGGQLIQTGKFSKVRLWADLVQEHHDRVRKLVLARAKLREQAPPAAGELKDYETWLRAVKAKQGAPRKRRRPRRRRS